MAGAAPHADDEALARALQAREDEAALGARRAVHVAGVDAGADAELAWALQRAEIAAGGGASSPSAPPPRAHAILPQPSHAYYPSLATSTSASKPAAGSSSSGGGVGGGGGESDAELARRLDRELNGARGAADRDPGGAAGEDASDCARWGGSGAGVAAGAADGAADEALARRLQREWDGQPARPPGGALASVPTAAPAPRPAARAPDACAGCGLRVPLGGGVRVRGVPWHARCLRCAACGAPIVAAARGGGGGIAAALSQALGAGTGASARFVESGGRFYHPACAREALAPRCAVCQDFVSPDAEGGGEGVSYPYYKAEGAYFAQAWCRWHGPRPPACCACRRVEPVGAPFAEHNDGRKICLECLGSVVVDSRDAAPLVEELFAWFDAMGARVELRGRARFPVYLVDAAGLRAARIGEGDGHHYVPPGEGGGGGGGVADAGGLEVRGLCVTRSRTLRVVERAAAQTGASRGARGLLSRALAVAPREVTVALRTDVEVAAVLALFGLPQLLTAAVLVHELTHAFIKLDGGFPELEPFVEEGLCQLMAWVWLQQQPETRLRNCFAHAIEHERDAVYGGGFRAARDALEREGSLAALLARVRAMGSFGGAPAPTYT